MSAVRIITGAAATALAFSVKAVASGAEDGLEKQLAVTLAAFLDRRDLPGVSAAIALPDGTVTGAAAGLADVESGRAMTPGTRMLAASIGKTFVGATVLALESEGRLSPADLLADHLGDHRWFAGLPNADAITLGQLLRHGAGLPDHVHLPAFQAAARAHIAAGSPVFTPEELIGFVTDQEALSAPDLARWGHALFTGAAMTAPYLDWLLDSAPVAPGVRYGASVAIYSETPFGPVYGHGGWIPGFVSSLRHYAGHGVTVAFQINGDAGVVDDSSDHVPGLEAALARLAIEAQE